MFLCVLFCLGVLGFWVGGCVLGCVWVCLVWVVLVLMVLLGVFVVLGMRCLCGGRRGVSLRFLG